MLYRYRRQNHPKTQCYWLICTVSPLSHALTLQESKPTKNAILLPYQHCWPFIPCTIVARVKFDQKAILLSYMHLLYHGLSLQELNFYRKLHYYCPTCIVYPLTHALSSQETNSTKMQYYCDIDTVDSLWQVLSLQEWNSTKYAILLPYLSR